MRPINRARRTDMLLVLRIPLRLIFKSFSTLPFCSMTPIRVCRRLIHFLHDNRTLRMYYVVAYYHSLRTLLTPCASRPIFRRYVPTLKSANYVIILSTHEYYQIIDRKTRPHLKTRAIIPEPNHAQNIPATIPTSLHSSIRSDPTWITLLPKNSPIFISER